MRCKGTVAEIKKGRIPYTNIVTVECEDGRKIEMLMHEDLITFAKGAKVEFVIDENLPNFKQGEDFCGRGKLVRDDGEKKLFSIGGFPVILYNVDEKYDDKKKYYICLIKEE